VRWPRWDSWHAVSVGYHKEAKEDS